MAEQENGTAYVLTAKQERYLRLKYGIDAVAAAVLLALFAAPMAVIALSLKLLSPGEPVLFRHRRLGENGKPFELVKFRTMRTAGPPGRAEERVTRFGRFLRSTSLDELPQLVHVLSGKMSLIGPRPLVPQEREVHELRMAYGVYRLRPGLTGWAQINGRDRVNAREKAWLDRQYLEHISFSLDWRIFWITVVKVLSRSDVQTGPK